MMVAGTGSLKRPRRVVVAIAADELFTLKWKVLKGLLGLY